MLGLWESDELPQLLGCDWNDDRLRAVLERVRRAVPVVHGFPIELALARFVEGWSYLPTYDDEAHDRRTRDDQGFVSEAPRYFDRPLGELSADEARVAQLDRWVHEEPSLLDLILRLRDVRSMLGALVDDDARAPLTSSVKELLLAVGKSWQDPRTKAPRARRALVRLADSLPALFPDLPREVSDEVAHLVGEHLGVANLGDEGFDPADRAKVRRAHVMQWRKDITRPPRVATRKKKSGLPPRSR